MDIRIDLFWVTGEERRCLRIVLVMTILCPYPRVKRGKGQKIFIKLSLVCLGERGVLTSGCFSQFVVRVVNIIRS